MKSYKFSDLEDVLRRAERYVHSCQTQDGGYFFARVPPGSLLDSYFAAQTLQLLGAPPANRARLVKFVEAALQTGIVDIHALYLATRICLSLGNRPAALLSRWQKVAGSSWLPAAPGTLYIEVDSELERVREVVTACVSLGIPLARDAVIKAVASARNQDGSYGSRGAMRLPTTCDAIQTLALLGCPPAAAEVLPFLRLRDKEIYFIEELYYLSGIRAGLGLEIRNRDGAVAFIRDCQRESGGFARARPMGIATLEYTFYAVSLLRRMGGFS